MEKRDFMFPRDVFMYITMNMIGICNQQVLHCLENICGDFSEISSVRLRHLNIWSPVGGIVWEGL